MEIKTCPDKPNCVSSVAKDYHYIAPIEFKGDAAECKLMILDWVKANRGGLVLKNEDQYMHITWRSTLGFIDDLELFFDQRENRTHLQLRSAARTGYWDLGVNRRRVESLRKFLHKN